jgi:prepilin-type N-terminal cleavage/methylation domain-containing protein
MMKNGGHGKSPYAALRFRPRHCGVRKSTPHSSGVARLASGTFPEAAADPFIIPATAHVRTVIPARVGIQGRTGCRIKTGIATFDRVICSRHKKGFVKGFTLIEILIAILILGIVLTTIYASYTGTFRIIKETEYDAEVYGIARSALDRFSRDLQSVALWNGSFAFKTTSHYLGNREFVRLLFRSAAHVSFSENEAPEGVAVIEYRIEEGTEKEGYALWRSDSLYRDPGKEDTAASGYLLGERVEELTWLFYDDKGKEYDSWDSGGDIEAQKKKAPTSVLIRLSFVNEANRERPYLFSTRVHLPFNRPEVQ